MKTLDFFVMDDPFLLFPRTTVVNLIKVQRLGLRLRLKKASTGIHRGLRLTVIFESYKHELEAY